MSLITSSDGIDQAQPAWSGGGKVSLETELSTNFKLPNLSEGT